MSNRPSSMPVVRGDLLVCSGALAAAFVVDWLTRTFPASLPFIAPWDFSWSIFLAATLGLWWYWRGVVAASGDRAPPPWRRACFLGGTAAIYGVLQTRFQYLTLHMFYLTSIQHVVIQHIGPFLVALGLGGNSRRLEMPIPFLAVLERRVVEALRAAVRQPAVAGFLFAGTFLLWLVPGVQFQAMIDPRVYALMNWTLVLAGLVFWSLVLDPRPKPPARLSVRARLALATSVMVPELAAGMLIAFAGRDLYRYYDLCGRLDPSVSAKWDQTLGGVILALSPAVMSGLAVLVILAALDRHRERGNPGVGATLASRWTRW